MEPGPSGDDASCVTSVVCPMMNESGRSREGRHAGTVEEWLFTAWTPGADLGLLSGHRIVGRTAWYWAALVRAGRDLLHIVDFDVPVRADPFVVKGEALWAEHTCDAPFEQWSIGNETYASGLADPVEALGRAYGTPTPIAFDLEWYATGGAVDLPQGYTQPGAVHGSIEVLGEDPIHVAEIPAARWHRWADAGPADPRALGPVEFPAAVAHTGLRAPFRFPDATVADLVLTAAGWHAHPSRLVNGPAGCGTVSDVA